MIKCALHFNSCFSVFSLRETFYHRKKLRWQITQDILCCLKHHFEFRLCCTAGKETLEMMVVRGKQDLKIQGPRLNQTKEDKMTIRRGPDKRLDPIITPPMPLLEVSVTHKHFKCSSIVGARKVCKILKFALALRPDSYYSNLFPSTNNKQG